jgi:hypothetical protein
MLITKDSDLFYLSGDKFSLELAMCNLFSFDLYIAFEKRLFEVMLENVSFMTAEEKGEESSEKEKLQRRSSVLSGVWSLMRNQNRRASQQQSGGMYLEEFDVNSLDPETAALYFPASYRVAASDSKKLPRRPSLTGILNGTHTFDVLTNRPCIHKSTKH